MPYQICKFQNASGWTNETPTIVISIDTPEWNSAYLNWINGDPPTKSKEWEKGIWACFESVLEPCPKIKCSKMRKNQT